MSSNAPGSRRRKRILLSGVTLALLLALLLLFELLFRLIGIGTPTTFFLAAPLNGGALYRDNPSATAPYFGPDLARAPAPFFFPAEKGEHTFRIFVLGGSAAAGDPEPAYSFSRILDAMLTAANPEIHLEVVNASMTAVNSHVLRRAMKEIVQHEPDLVILYLGHNEVVGPFGPGSLFGRFTPSRGDIALRTTIRASRVGQAWSHTVQRLGRGPAAPDRWQGMGMFLDRQIGRDDPRLETVYGHFRRNLIAMLKEARAASAHVLLCTVASDARDCPPFASLVSPPLLPSEGQRLQALLQERSQEALTEAIQLAPTHAEAHHRMGTLLKEEDAAKAASAYKSARDLDALRFRADTRINNIIREVAHRAAPEDVTLLDMEEAADQRPPLPWPDLFLDHVHFSHRGNHWMAAQLAEVLRTRWPNRLGGSVPDAETIDPALAWSGWAEWRIAREMSRRHAKPPFTQQWDHAERTRQWAVLLSAAMDRTAKHAEDIASMFQRAVANAPEDWFLLHSFGEFLIDQALYAEALPPLRQAWKRTPHRDESRTRLALALAGSGHYEELHLLLNANGHPLQAAIDFGRIGVELGERGSTPQAVETLRHACSIAPENASLRATLGGALLVAGQGEEAEAVLRQALQLDEALADARNNLGSALALQGRMEEATDAFRTAFERDPAHAPARQNLLRALQQAAMADAAEGREERAVARLREALEIEPLFLPAMVDLAMLHATSRNPAVFSAPEALLWAQRARQAETAPQARVRLALASALTARGMNEEAEKFFQETLALIPPAERGPWRARIQALFLGIQDQTKRQGHSADDPERP